MTFDDLLLAHRRDSATLRQALAIAIDVSTHDVGVVESSTESTGGARVRCVLGAVRGEFECLIELSVDEGVRTPERIVIARRLSELLHTTVFYGDDSPSPWSGLLISGDSERAASLDPDAEERGEFRLFRSSQFGPES